MRHIFSVVSQRSRWFRYPVTVVFFFFKKNGTAGAIGGSKLFRPYSGCGAHRGEERSGAMGFRTAYLTDIFRSADLKKKEMLF